MKPFDFVPDSCHGILMEKIATVFHMGEDVVELDLLPKSGMPVPYFFTGRLVTYAGEPCVLGVGLDCSEKVEARLQTKTTTEQLGKLAALLQNIREEERVEIARDIHDDLGQQLTAIKLALFRLEDRVAGNSSASEIVEQVIDWTGMTIESIRRISSNLHPGILADQGLLGALKWQIEEFERKFRIPVTAELSAAAVINTPAIAISLFRVFQEALTNIARHAAATRVDVDLKMVGGTICMNVRDNGKGLDPYEKRTGLHLGLLSMKERISSIGGHLAIESVPRVGTVIHIEIPASNAK